MRGAAVRRGGGLSENNGEWYARVLKKKKKKRKSVGYQDDGERDIREESIGLYFAADSARLYTGGRRQNI